jgi:hypothetical protein
LSFGDANAFIREDSAIVLRVARSSTRFDTAPTAPPTYLYAGTKQDQVARKDESCDEKGRC